MQRSRHRGRIDTVRASRDGHEYHEAWTARKALQLLWPDSELVAIAVEGVSPVDRTRVSAQTIEIADLTLYYGGQPSVAGATRTSFVQFKYSVASGDTEFRASHAKKTIEKFAHTYLEHSEKYGANAAQAKLSFQLITNQPIYRPLLLAIDALAQGLVCAGEIAKQAEQVRHAARLRPRALSIFASLFRLIGLSGSLPKRKDELANLLVDWSATNDPIAAARLGRLRALVREKAGYAGTTQNLICRPDVLAALEVGDPRDLLPCPSALTDVGIVLEREQLAGAVSEIPTLSVPLLIHAAGGVGKTVFMDSLATKVRESHEVVFFDCFGGGAYRSPEDARHLPARGLIHIANTLAFRGLCDPMLPDGRSVESLLLTFRRRLVQSIDTLSRATPGRGLALFIDAIDNADIAARQRSDDSFPAKLMESLDTEPIPGLRLVVSCRTERKPDTYAKFREFQLFPFSVNETSAFLRARLENASEVEINVAQARSCGNPRVLDYLVMSGRGELVQSEIGKPVQLDDIIQQRIADALDVALERGYKQADVDAFLAGLAVLPPPVPVDEYAGAHALELSLVESFAADLSPLLERSSQGLMFKDEPTETLVRGRYASSGQAMRRLADNLFARQAVSVYASRALPGLLHELNDGETLFALAFDDRIPSSITSTVGRRNIRYARLKAATLHAAINADYNQLVRLLVELSTIAAVDQRGAAYIVDHPDLVVAAKDVDATRRLFESRTGWPGTRHARLTIANTLAGESQEAYREAAATNEWLQHYRHNCREGRAGEPGPERADVAAIGLFLVSQRRADDAVRFLKAWLDWYSFEVCECVFGYLDLSGDTASESPRRAGEFVASLDDIGPLTAVLSFREVKRPRRRELVARLARSCRKSGKVQLPDRSRHDEIYSLQDGLWEAAGTALSLGLVADALAILGRTPHQRPRLWLFRTPSYDRSVLSFVLRATIRSAAKGSMIHEKDLLPVELAAICSGISRNVTGEPFREKANARLKKYFQQLQQGTQRERAPAWSYDDDEAARRFVGQSLGPLLSIAKAVSSVLTAPSRGADRCLLSLLEVCERASGQTDRYSGTGDRFFRFLTLDAAAYVLRIRKELKVASVERLLAMLHRQGVGATDLVRLISILARRPHLHGLAGEQAVKARKLIEAEDEVNHRAHLFANLGRALLPASRDEASAYFREGLEQMDSIGSGDFEFTNELLLFASCLRGAELDERDFHTLSNICELNMGEDPEKFFWGAYGRGMSKAAGTRGLAKLSRWDDRSKIALSHTLLPSLIALVEDGKLGPKDALALNRLAAPVEYYHFGTAEFAHAIREKAGPDPEGIRPESRGKRKWRNLLLTKAHRGFPRRRITPWQRLAESRWLGFVRTFGSCWSVA